MCQIQIIFNTEGKNISQTDLIEFEKLMCFGSMENKDAFGVFNSSYLFKNKGRFKPHQIDKKTLSKDYFLVGHNRYATSGFGGESSPISNKKSGSLLSNLGEAYLTSLVPPFFKIYDEKKTNENINNHPFVLDDFVLIHNGVIGNANMLRSKFNIPSDVATDSFVILYLINRFFKKSKQQNRTLKIAEAISRTTKEISGSYSVFCLDKKTKSLYYFKDAWTSFSLFKVNNLLVGSTDEENLRYVYSGNKKKSLEILPNHVYKLNKDINNPLSLIVSTDNFKKDYSEEEKIRDKLYNLFGFHPEIKLKKDKVLIYADDRIEYKILKNLPYKEKGIFFIKYEVPKNIFVVLKGGKKKK